MKKMLLFDIDGTLLLSGGAGKSAFEAAFSEMFGIPDTWQDTVPDGRTDPLIFGEIILRVLGRDLNPGEWKQLYLRYTDHFRRTVREAAGFRLMPGIERLIPELASQASLLLGIATGNIGEVSRLKLERAGLAAHFTFGGFGCDSPLRPAIVEKAIGRGEKKLGCGIDREKDVLVIGDTHHDILAAREAGVRVAAVATGNVSRDELARHEPDYLFPDLSDTAVFLRSLA